MNSYGLSPDFSSPYQPPSAQLSTPKKKTSTSYLGPTYPGPTPPINPMSYTTPSGTPYGPDNSLQLANQYGDAYYNQLQKGMQDYYNKAGGIYQQSHDLTANNLNTQNTNLLGTQGQDASNAFLNSIYDPALKQEGSLQYGYNMDKTHENNAYGIQSGLNTSFRDLALNKLANDEKIATQKLNLQQGIDNQGKIEDLNSRGLTYGQSPTGGYQVSPIGGLNGVAGQQAGLQNQDYANQYGALNSTYGLNQQGANLDYQNAQQPLDETHRYNLQNNAFGTVNNINDQNRNYSYQTGVNNNQLAQNQLQLAQQQNQQQINNRAIADQYGARKAGVPYQ